MMLDHEGAVEAERLGLEIIFDEVTVPFRAVELAAAPPCRGAAEQTEPHLCVLVTFPPRTLKGIGRLAKCRARP